eukprot:CAMPEP_0174702098 /NCGR_PEP_ID=MMETSP1094-20130205/6500_1 /TAXON_ID=156173 /ORGANISM="Chrysochromulina brevifilum, Strain UTEX LB 985" /LENGTH=65 /DNA_ID=CAMNT_0015899827 /DNA_START=748 /DNA_END=941 /DNA_ORIENTATION=+
MEILVRDVDCVVLDAVLARLLEGRIRSKRPKQLANVLLSPARVLIKLAHELISNTIRAPLERAAR